MAASVTSVRLTSRRARSSARAVPSCSPRASSEKAWARPPVVVMAASCRTVRHATSALGDDRPGDDERVVGGLLHDGRLELLVLGELHVAGPEDPVDAHRLRGVARLALAVAAAVRGPHRRLG